MLVISAGLFPRSPSAAQIGRRRLLSEFSFSTPSWYNNKSGLTLKPMASISTEVEKPRKPWLFVGLGNPGKRYSDTRHNVGFELIDYIAEAEGISTSSISFKSAFGKGFIGDVPVMLAKPQTFMNASGESVGALVSYHKIPLDQVLVMFDDMDLPFAKLRLLPKGGHGGHNGMRSIITHLKGSQDFPRLRIGIGRPPGKMDAANFVLRPFNRQEREERVDAYNILSSYSQLDFTFQNGLEAVRILVQQDFNRSATFVNSAKSLTNTS
ncbi:peptidyl-tRNA hydrolase, mitochondrial-like isoform X2 [Salvia splendens]|uniref:peptidyl-tRNA hydrolase, mitochondrial-like isoform X2 n=1 Tax=Salvia splendens TaxID=180675 RepID=UPI001C2665D9|nr:peptidyl-tRNA hydrolase, mitochondrial-like isoform X2 [Salvia splendens]